MIHEDAHVVCIHPDDEDREVELNAELGRLEDRMVEARVAWLRALRVRRGWV